MAWIIISIVTLLVLAADSQTVISGALNGLMLWYKNVLPILLPFMLVSGVLVRHVNCMKNTDKDKERFGIFITVLLGVLCGYPLGANTASNFIANGTYSKKTGNILLPLCNNSSPMFISGYIVHGILNNSLNMSSVLFLIYAPYIALIILNISSAQIYKNIICGKARDNKNNSPKTDSKKALLTTKQTDETDPILNAIRQITFVGVYIMICSIIIEFTYKLPMLNEKYYTYIAGITEITRGTYEIKNSVFLSSNTKTALILAMTSFGGISSILQTNKVIGSSGLSIIRYIYAKIICAAGTFALTLLLI